MNNKRYFLSFLLMLLSGVMYFPIQAQQKKATHHTDFSGEWKSKESISMGGNIVCSYNEGDRMLSKAMKISQQPNFLTIEIPNTMPGAALTTHENLATDGKENLIHHGKERGKKSTVKFSADGKTMTISSIVHLMVATSYNVAVQQKAFVYVKEVWNLSNDGKSIIVQTNANSNIFDDVRSWTTVFDKAN